MANFKEGDLVVEVKQDKVSPFAGVYMRIRRIWTPPDATGEWATCSSFGGEYDIPVTHLQKWDGTMPDGSKAVNR